MLNCIINERIMHYKNLYVNIYGFKLCIKTDNMINCELKKYYSQFIVNNIYKVDLTYCFVINKDDQLSREIKSLPNVDEKWKDVFILDNEGKIDYFLIPDKGYPVVLINQIINNLTGDRLISNSVIPFHAAAVSKNKNAILLMGEQMSGKTTLSLSLALNDYKYFTDDMALIDLKTNKVLPYFNGITPRKNTIEMFPQIIENEFSHPYFDFDSNEKRWCVELVNVFKNKISNACKLKYIIFPKYNPNARLIIKPVSKAAAIVNMLRNMKIVPTIVLGSNSVEVMNKILNCGVYIWSVEYPDKCLAMQFIDSLYKE